MTELLTSAQMRAIETAAIERGEVTGLELMERAGRGVVAAIFEEWPDLRAAPHRAVVLCGPGNNGGDGFVIARLLKDWGWEVEVFLYGRPEKLPPDAKANHDRWSGMGKVGLLSFPQLAEVDARSLAAAIRGALPPRLLVDALFGTGLQRPITGLRPLLDLLEEGPPLRTVAVDIPSGLCADSGAIIGAAAGEGHPQPAVRADLTVPFHRPKLGHMLAEGPNLCGALRTRDIELAQPEMAGLARAAAPHARGLRKPAAGHKYGHGHALILSGGPGRGGAARLAARGALRIGAGLVTVGCPPEAVTENAAQLNAIMLKPVHDADALGRILEDPRIGALGLGPALGTGEREAALVARALAAGRATVLDADALTLIAGDGSLMRALHGACVLTPHAGEFARLFPDLAERLNAPATTGPAWSKADATRAAAARAGCTVLFKGPDTVIADPSGRCAISSAHYDRAAPWLATAGSGDVLTGMIAGLLARGFAPLQAAETAAWLHVECALSFGPGLIAEDLPEELPRVFRKLGL